MPLRSSFSASPRPEPVVSVLVPTYNYARFLPDALESVLAQNFRDFELLVSDDASTDGSADFLRTFARRDPRIRCALHRTNLGMVENWNWCLQQARGRYVKFLFGDDVLVSPDSLAQLTALLEREPRAQLAASARLLLDDRSRVTGLADELRAGFHDGPRLIARCLRTRTNLIGEPSVVLFRRPSVPVTFTSAYRQIVDLEFWFQFLQRGGLTYTRTPLCGFRRHGTQQTAVNHRSAAPHVEMLQLLEQYVSEPQVRTHLRLGSFAHQRLLFCHVHYARKSAVRSPEFLAAVDRLERQISPRWRLACWFAHRLTRPAKNLSRKLRNWSSRARTSSAQTAFWPTTEITHKTS